VTIVNGRHVAQAELAEMVAHRMARLQENVDTGGEVMSKDEPPPYLGQCACGKFMVVPRVTLVDSDDVAHNVNACQEW